MQAPDIHRLLELQRFLDTFQRIQRTMFIPDGSRHENDTEHSYNLAMSAWYLSQFFDHLDRDTVIRIAMVHDLVEIHAGDTYFYADASTLRTKAKREAAALQRLRKEWADFPEMTNMIAAYEHRTSEEAKFVYALDKIMPVMVIYLGGGHTWKQHNITHQMLHDGKKQKVTASKEISHYYNQLHALLLDNPELFAKGPSHKA